MASVFVSYAHEDVVKARALAHEIGQAGFDVWIDQRIGSGSEFSREIERALADASAVVVLWSKNSIDSSWVRDEAAEGRDSGRLVPVLLDNCRPPIGFRQFQTTDLSGWSGRGRPKQLDNVIRAVRAKSEIPTTPIPKPKMTPAWKRPFALATAAFAVLAIALVAFMLAGRASTGRAAAPSLAILPFTADASDTDARKLASAAHDAVAHTLSQGAFAISAIDVPPPGGTPSADFLISGQVTSAPDRFVATVRMEETANHFVVFSHRFEAKRNEVGDFPERIGAQVASQLSWTAPLLALERRHPSEPAIVAALLQSDTSGQGGDVATLRDYETSRRLAEKAPNSPLAQNQLAFNTAFALDQIPRAERAEAVMAARRAADRTIKLAPEYGSAYVPWCLLHSTVELAACELRLRTGIRADADDPFANWFLSRLLNNVGRNAEAVQLASLSLAHDPYMPLKIAQSVRLLEATGRTEEAGKLYHQSTIWWPANEAIIWYRLSGMMERGDFSAMEQFGDEVGGDFKPSAALAAIARRSLPNARHECANPRMPDEIPCLLGLADLGDLDAAFSLADRVYPSLLGRSPTEQDHIWLESPGQSPFGYITSPAAAALRHDPRYLALAQRTGLLAYWRNGRLPDFCNPPHPEPVCARL